MTNYSQQVNQQYGREQLIDRILTVLKDAGKDIDNLTREDLSTFDEFHIGGLAETRKLVGHIPDFNAGSRVLDVGSGLGGPARTLAAEFECTVTGLDLTEEYCKAAIKLTDLVGLADQIKFQQGNALDMPFDDDQFDVVWTQFTAMNISDKKKLYEQCHRVLRHDGYLAFHEVLDGATPDWVFPVFWADTKDVNFLRSPESVQQILEEVGFELVYWADLTQYSFEWFEAMLAKRATNPSEKPPLGFNIFVGKETPQ